MAETDAKVKVYFLSRPDVGATSYFCGRTVEQVLNCVRAELSADFAEDADGTEILLERREMTQKEIDELPDFDGF